MRSLVGADSPHAARVELHRSWIEDGVARMAREEAIEVPAGATVRFEPGGLHLMLFDAQLTPGSPVPLRLWFDDGSLREVVARVAADAGDSHAGHEHHAH
jgi:copper(I)-binding protein